MDTAQSPDKYQLTNQLLFIEADLTAYSTHLSLLGDQWN